MRSSIFAICLFVVAGCSKPSDTAPKPEAAGSASPASAHAPKGATPGSYEDWCGEHAVPESQCTRCNKELIPAFKATNDWCATHEVPESQCTKCNPGLKIERPKKPGT